MGQPYPTTMDEAVRMYPAPFSVLRHKFPGTFRRALAIGLSLDDIGSECLLGLYDAVLGFDPTRGTGFFGYAAHKMRGRVSRAIEMVTRHGDRAVALDDCNAAAPEPDDSRDTDEVDRVLRAVAALPEHRRKVIADYYGLGGGERLTDAEAARKSGTSRQNMTAIRQYALHCLRVTLGVHR